MTTWTWLRRGIAVACLAAALHVGGTALDGDAYPPLPTSTATSLATPGPVLLPPLSNAHPGAVVLTATVSATGTFFLSTRVNGLRIGLRVPPGAVQRPTVFRVTLAATAIPIPVTGCTRPVGVGNAYDFTARTVSGGAAVTAFGAGLFLRLDIPRAALHALTACTVGIAYRRGSTWVFLRSSALDATTGAVTGITTHFTVFQVRAVARVQVRVPALRETPAPRPTVTLPLPRPHPTATAITP